jgi:hypothetical protein
LTAPARAAIGLPCRKEQLRDARHRVTRQKNPKIGSGTNLDEAIRTLILIVAAQLLL